MKCPTCNTELTQKNRPLLFTVGVLMIVSIGIAFHFPLFWVPGIAVVIIGSYLVLWSTRGKGLWCRTCKKAPLLN